MLVGAGAEAYTPGMSAHDFATVLAFGSAAELLGWSSRKIRITVGERLSALVEELEGEHPQLREAREQVRYVVNQQQVSEDAVLKPGCEVAILPPASGGAEGRLSAARPPTARLVRDPIDLAALVREVESVSVGAIATLSGTVRYETDEEGQTLKALEYHAYEPMALAEMHRLCAEATKRFPVHKALLVHRLGLLRIGEVSVAVAVSSPHRTEAVQACRMLIDGLAAAVPIFCKQIWQGGATAWVNEV